MPPKKAKKPRARRAPAKKHKGLKQKQKQRQVVNVNVSGGGSGGGGGGTQFIPMPQAPSFDYSLLANLIRPANTVDVPIRAAAPMAEPIAMRAAEPEGIRPSFMEMESQTSGEPITGAGRAVFMSDDEVEPPNVRRPTRTRTEAQKEKRRQSDVLARMRREEEAVHASQIPGNRLHKPFKPL